jgi:hypothetical protein
MRSTRRGNALFKAKSPVLAWRGKCGRQLSLPTMIQVEQL